MDELKELQMNIIFYKKKTNLKNKDISAITGIPVDTISRICTGKTKHPKYATVKLIANALGCSVDDLLGNENAVKPYYLDENTGAIAQTLKNNPDLKNLFDVLKDLSKDDLQTFTGIANILKKNKI